EPHIEISTRAGRRYAKTGEGDEIIGVAPAGPKDRLAVVTESSRALVCPVSEVNELAGPGKGGMVIKLDGDDRVIAFLCTSRKDSTLELETSKGRKLTLTPHKYELASRGGRGHEMVKRDRVKLAQLSILWTPLPEQQN